MGFLSGDYYTSDTGKCKGIFFGVADKMQKVQGVCAGETRFLERKLCKEL